MPDTPELDLDALLAEIIIQPEPPGFHEYHVWVARGPPISLHKYDAAFFLYEQSFKDARAKALKTYPPPEFSILRIAQTR